MIIEATMLPTTVVDFVKKILRAPSQEIDSVLDEGRNPMHFYQAAG